MLQTPASGNVSKFTVCSTIHRIKQRSKNTRGGPGKKKSIFKRYHISEVTAVSQENKSNVKGLTCSALTGVGELKALVRVGSIGVELQPQVVGGAVQDEPHQLVPSEGAQGPRQAVLSIVDLRRTIARAPWSLSSVHMPAILTRDPNFQTHDFIQFFRKLHSL